MRKSIGFLIRIGISFQTQGRQSPSLIFSPTSFLVHSYLPAMNFLS